MVYLSPGISPQPIVSTRQVLYRNRIHGTDRNVDGALVLLFNHKCAHRPCSCCFAMDSRPTRANGHAPEACHCCLLWNSPIVLILPLHDSTNLISDAVYLWRWLPNWLTSGIPQVRKTRHSICGPLRYATKWSKAWVSSQPVCHISNRSLMASKLV